MKKLKESDRSRILTYLSQEPDVNVFFVNIIENNSIESDGIGVYASEVHDPDEKGEPSWSMLILKYYENYILYSHHDYYPTMAVVDFLKQGVIDAINGKASILRRIAPHFPHMKMIANSMLRLDDLNEDFSDKGKAKIRLLTVNDAEKIVDLYMQSNEYIPFYNGDKERYIAERRENLAGNGIAIGLFYRYRLVSVAEITAFNNSVGLLVGIATHPKYRNQGFTTKTVVALCEEAFRLKKKHICIVHDNPRIKNILTDIGFRERNQYALLN